MAELFGKRLSKGDLQRRIGDMGQVGGVRVYQLAEGRAAGVRAVDFRTACGLDFTVLIDRGLDISRASFRGVPLAWISATGEVSPAYFEPRGYGWQRGFFGGLVTTCGLTYCGHPSLDEGEELGLHGRISNIPARNISVDGRWEEDEYHFWVKGEMVEAEALGLHMVLTRRISARLSEKKLWIDDIVENRGYRRAPHMMLYHMNFGYPLLSADSKLLIAPVEVVPRDRWAEKELGGYSYFSEPEPDYQERCYQFRLREAKDGYVQVALVNESLLTGGLGIYLRFPKSELPFLLEWKLMREGVYVVAVEPANCPVNKRNILREQGTLPFLEPGESRHYHIEVGILEGREEISTFVESLPKGSAAGD